MMHATDIALQIKNKYSSSVIDINVQRERRLWLELVAGDFRKCFERLIKEDGFEILVTITGLDTGAKYEVIYHMSDKEGRVLNIKISIDRDNPVVSTITDLFPAAELSERELMDLLGIKVEGLPEGRRYPLPDNWPQGQYPLRKDWDPSVLDKKIEKSGDKND